MNAPAAFPTQQIQNRLEFWRPQIERALEQFGCQTYNDICQDVVEVKKLLFDNGNAFAVVDIQDYSQGRVAHVLVAGGSLQGLRDLQDLTAEFFRAIGVKKMTLLGRKGFLRRLPDLGWKQTMVFMERIL